jgi:hypothetical protein
MNQWLIDTARFPFRIENEIRFVASGTIFYTVGTAYTAAAKILFKSKEDAALFKLFWM